MDFITVIFLLFFVTILALAIYIFFFNKEFLKDINMKILSILNPEPDVVSQQITQPIAIVATPPVTAPSVTPLVPVVPVVPSTPTVEKFQNVKPMYVESSCDVSYL